MSPGQRSSSKELNTDVYIISWDKKRAFDRPPKPAILLGMIRAGIPRDIAETLVQLGIGGDSYIKSDLLIKAIIEKDIEMLQNLRFSTETGTPQGDNQAALSWNLFIDIFIRAIYLVMRF